MLNLAISRTAERHAVNEDSSFVTVPSAGELSASRSQQKSSLVLGKPFTNLTQSIYIYIFFTSLFPKSSKQKVGGDFVFQ